MNENETASSEALDHALNLVHRQYGKAALFKLGQQSSLHKQTAIPTGSISLDIATGIGGFPRGRVVEIFGPESSGKTTLALHAAANAQKEGGVAAVIDAEHALDPQYARRIGIDINQLLVSQPDHAEQALEICELLVRSNAVDLIVIDSVAALVPKAEIAGEMGDMHVGLQARLMSQALRKLTSIVSKTNACVIFLNQIRTNIGVMWGNPETTPGGRALKFYASMRLDIRRVGNIKEGEDVTGMQARVKIIKNKVAAPYKNAEFDIIFNKGICAAGDVLSLAASAGIVKRAGNWFKFEELQLGQGRKQAVEFLESSPEVFGDIKNRIFQSINDWQDDV